MVNMIHSPRKRCEPVATDPHGKQDDSACILDTVKSYIYTCAESVTVARSRKPHHAKGHAKGHEQSHVFHYTLYGVQTDRMHSTHWGVCPHKYRRCQARKAGNLEAREWHVRGCSDTIADNTSSERHTRYGRPMTSYGVVRQCVLRRNDSHVHKCIIILCINLEFVLILSVVRGIRVSGAQCGGVNFEPVYVIFRTCALVTATDDADDM